MLQTLMPLIVVLSWLALPVTLICIADDCVRLVLGMRIACRAMSCSSSVGANSCPNRRNSNVEPRKATTASGTTTHRRRMEKRNKGS